MRVARDFRERYRVLESRMRALAEADGDVFLPNPEPGGPVDYLLICMEPSLGWWAESAEDAKAKVKAGFRNFVSSLEDFILHFCARHYLCEAEERYHVTDLAKGAMLVAQAGTARAERYDRWYAVLQEEIDLVSRPGVGIVAIGSPVAEHLQRRGFTKSFTRVIHYSRQAAAARKAGIIGREREFEAFRNSVAARDVLRDAEAVLISAGLPSEYIAATLSMLAKSNLSESRRQLIFSYKTAFEAIKHGRAQRGRAV
jgi:hypothetical protein